MVLGQTVIVTRQPEVALSISNGYVGKANDGTPYRLVAIGRRSGSGYSFWDPRGTIITTPVNYRKLTMTGLDTVLIIEEPRFAQREFLTVYGNTLLPLDSAGSIIQTSMGRGIELGIVDSTAGVVDRSVNHYAVPFAVVNANGTADFQFRAFTNKVDVVETLLPKSGRSAALRSNIVVKTEMKGKETQMEVSYKPAFSNGIPLRISAQIRDSKMKVRTIQATGIAEKGNSTRVWFTIVNATVEKLLVERRILSNIRIVGVPMAPSGVTVPMTTLTRVSSDPIGRMPALGEVGGSLTAWNGRTVSGANYRLTYLLDKSGAWSPSGLPIMESWVGGDRNLTQFFLSTSAPISGEVQVVRQADGEVMPFTIVYPKAGSGPLTTFGIPTSELLDDTMMLRFMLNVKGRLEAAEVQDVHFRRIVWNRPL